MKINGRDVSNENRLTVFGGVNVIESDDLLNLKYYQKNWILIMYLKPHSIKQIDLQWTLLEVLDWMKVLKV